MNIDYYEDFEPKRFQPVAKFHKGGAQRVFYKGKADKIEPTEEEKAFKEVAINKWRQYQEVDRPAENNYMQDVDRMNSEEAYDFAGGVSNSATSSSFQGAKNSVNDRLESQGVNPNSGKFKAAMSGLSDAQGASAADTSSRARIQQQDEYIQGLSNINAIGNGQSTQTQNGLSDIAQTAENKAASDARTKWNNDRANHQAIGTVVGGGLSAFNSRKPAASSAPFDDEGFVEAQKFNRGEMLS